MADESHSRPIDVKLNRNGLDVTITEMLMCERLFIRKLGYELCCVQNALDKHDRILFHFISREESK